MRSKKQEIEYFGRVISPQGVTPCPKKVKAILSLVAPSDKQELQSLLGTVNFMATFVPNVTKKTFLMRSLLKRDTHFVWTSDMQGELDRIKRDIANAVQLVHYDPKKTAIIETDASQKGLGAVLVQGNKPVRFLRLSTVEMNYSNIERELLAILFACEKLHTYTFRLEIVVHTDHRPLQTIFQKPISLAPSRLQRMLRLSVYNVQVKYVGFKSVLFADTLSRLVDPSKAKEIPGLDISIAQVIKVEPCDPTHSVVYMMHIKALLQPFSVQDGLFTGLNYRMISPRWSRHARNVNDMVIRNPESLKDKSQLHVRWK